MIHVRRHTPVPALLVTCVSTLLMLVTGDIYTLINYVGFVNYLWYGVTVAGLLLLRRREPHTPRPIKVHLLFPALYLLFRARSYFSSCGPSRSCAAWAWHVMATGTRTCCSACGRRGRRSASGAPCAGPWFVMEIPELSEEISEL
ncbi:large neutral amino acids transporter small subunit 2-like [Camarhynchus parvulus]|uniref:large neutral amino acids transporter small subunit 2-like n=1 Tax=Geospiza parvula TaxID=87175 RepID=UPI001237C8EA|nr:large neutral amino acids transporter small subunit 2-like [Camarhynchus parvulus]